MGHVADLCNRYTKMFHAVLNGLACAWCGTTLSRESRLAEATYCSQECAEEGRLRRGGYLASTKIRDAVFTLERGNCTLCNLDCHTLYQQVRALEPPSRLNKLLSAGWKLPASSRAVENLLQDPKEGDFWQVDHIRAVSEGGGGCGLENLRTLCVPCHQSETEKLRGRLKLRSPENKKDAESMSRRKQTRMTSFEYQAEPRKRQKIVEICLLDD